MSWRPSLALLLSCSAALAAGPFNGADTGGGSAALAPDARGREAPDRSFDVLSLNMDIRLDPAARGLRGVATYRMRRLAPGPITLDAVALDVSKVQVGGQDTSFRLEGDALIVPVEGSYGDQLDVVIAWSATPRSGLHFRGGGSDTFPHVYTQGEDEENRYWFPAWDHPNDRFAYTGTVHAPPGWRAMTNSNDDVPSYLIMLAAGRFDEVGAGDVTAWVPPGTPPEAVHKVLDPIPAMMAHYAERTGVPYPWGTYRQVFVQRFLYGGMENTGATVEEAGILLPGTMRGAGRDTEAVVSHELAHQWFGDLLTCRSWRELWLNEGFATFMANDWMAAAHDPDEAAAHVLGNFEASLDGPALAGRFHQGPDAPDNGRVYVKGASVLHMLRVMLGEDAFWAGIRRYVREHQRDLVDSHDLERALERESGQELGWFFQQWVELSEIPELTVRGSFRDGQAHVTVRQQVSAKKPAYTLPITVEFGTPDGPVRRRGWLTEASLELVEPMASPPLYVAFDPDKGVLARVDQQQDPAAWEAQIASPSPYARFAAIKALGDTDRSAPLAAILADPQRPLAQRQAAAMALGSQRALAPLVAALADPEDDLRRTAASQVGNCAGPEAAAALKRASKAELNPEVRASLLRSLALVDPDAAVVQARAALRSRERWEEGLRDAAAQVLGKSGRTGDIDLLLDPKLHFVRRFSALHAAATLALAEDDEGAREAAMARVARSAEFLLDDDDLRGQQVAISILADVGDHASEARLEAFRRAETVDDLRNAARDALTKIRSRGAPSTSPTDEQVRIDALEKRLEALEAEIEAAKDRH